MVGECHGSLGDTGTQFVLVGLPWKSLGERSEVPGAHGLCRASFGENLAGFKEKVQGVRVGVRDSAIAPQAREHSGILVWNLQLGREPLWRCSPRTNSGAMGSWKAPGPGGIGGLVLAAGWCGTRCFLGSRKG